MHATLRVLSSLAKHEASFNLVYFLIRGGDISVNCGQTDHTARENLINPVMSDGGGCGAAAAAARRLPLLESILPCRKGYASLLSSDPQRLPPRDLHRRHTPKRSNSGYKRVQRINIGQKTGFKKKANAERKFYEKKGGIYHRYLPLH